GDGCGNATERSTPSRRGCPATAKGRPRTTRLFFYVAALALDHAVAETAHPQVRVEVVEQVFVRRRQQEAGAAARAELADVEGQHFGQWAIEVGGELVGEEEGPLTPNPSPPLGRGEIHPIQRVRQPKAIALAVGQF